MGEGGGCVVTLAEGRIIGARVESCQCALRLSYFFWKGPATKWNEFSEKFQTAFHPPSFLENHNTIFFGECSKKAFNKGPKSAI